MNNKSAVKFEGGSKGEFWGTLVKGFSKWEPDARSADTRSATANWGGR